MAFSPDGRGRFAARGLGSLKDLPLVRAAAADQLTRPADGLP